jgi:hypothetical protein
MSEVPRASRPFWSAGQAGGATETIGAAASAANGPGAAKARSVEQKVVSMEWASKESRTGQGKEGADASPTQIELAGEERVVPPRNSRALLPPDVSSIRNRFPGIALAPAVAIGFPGTIARSD